MFRLLVIGLGVLAMMLMSAATWETNFELAKKEAHEQHKLILLRFSGSDWCVPCIRMEKEVFARDTFSHFAEKSLVMLEADFPRLAKHKQDKEVVKQNEALAEQYNKEGHFPLTLLLNEDGKVLKTWDGYSGQQPEEFIAQINAAH